MKKFYYTVVLLFVCTCGFGQDISIINPKNKEQLKLTFEDYYEKDYEDYRDKEKDNSIVYNNVVLNLYFKKIITSYATNTKDLSLEKYFLNADTDKKSLSIGRTFSVFSLFEENDDLKPLQKLRDAATFYFKLPLSKGFSNLYDYNEENKAYEWNNNIGVGFKITIIGNGRLGFKGIKQVQKNLEKDNDKGTVTKIEKIRTKIVKADIDKKIKNYLAGDKYANELELLEINTENDNELKKEKEKLIEKKYYQFYREIAEEEIKYSEQEKLITKSHVGWVTIEYYNPITKTEFKYSPDATTIKNSDFKEWELSLFYNYLLNYNSLIFLKKWSAKLTGVLSYYNTNNFIANSNTTSTFQPIINSFDNTQVLGKSTPVFIGDYGQFEATSLKAEFSSLLFNNTIGLSAAIEETFGEVENRNWKLGIPFSLKDKEDKPTINFEIEWREVNKEHTLGISIGYNFGKFIK